MDSEVDAVLVVSIPTCLLRIALIRVWLKSWTGIRTITYPEGSNNSFDVTFKYGKDSEVDPHFPKKFNRAMTTDVARRKLVRNQLSHWFNNVLTMLQTTCATILLPVLLAEKEHSEQPNVIHRKREVQIRVTCGKFPRCLKAQVLMPHVDICTTSLFSQSWLCASCGREMCSACGVSLSEVRFCTYYHSLGH